MEGQTWYFVALRAIKSDDSEQKYFVWSHFPIVLRQKLQHYVVAERGSAPIYPITRS
jgi:hypothetical protein